jgi:hypothetical protein
LEKTKGVSPPDRFLLKYLLLSNVCFFFFFCKLDLRLGPSKRSISVQVTYEGFAPGDTGGSGNRDRDMKEVLAGCNSRKNPSLGLVPRGVGSMSLTSAGRLAVGVIVLHPCPRL